MIDGYYGQRNNKSLKWPIFNRQMNDKFKIEGILASMFMNTSIISMNSSHNLCGPSQPCPYAQGTRGQLKSTFIPDAKYWGDLLGRPMPAISVKMGTIYACNLEFFKWLFNPRRSLSRCLKIFRDCRHIWSPFEPRMQAYMVPIVTQIAVILRLIYGPHLDWDCGPYYNQNCKHNQPPTPPI